MLTIFNKGQTEALSHHSEYELYENTEGACTLRFHSHNVLENLGHKLVEEEAIVESLDGRLFRLKQLQQTKKGVKVAGISTFYDLIGIQKKGIYGGSRTLNDFLTWLFADTGWTFEVIGFNNSLIIPNFGDSNFLKLLDVLVIKFKAEYVIKPNNHVIFAKDLGPDRDAQYRYGYNIKTLTRNVDTTNMRMSIRGRGKDGIEVHYISPNASKFPHIGEAEPFEDSDINNKADLLEEAKRVLIDNPEVAIELDALEITTKELGEKVWLEYTPLDLQFKTRILSKTTRIPESKSSAVIGTALPKTIGDELEGIEDSIEEEGKRTRSRIDQVDDRITIAVERFDGEFREAYAQWDITADGIRAEVGAVKIEMETAIGDALADSISYIDQTALQIQAGVDTQMEYVDGRFEEASSQMTILANQITASVAESATYTDTKFNIFNGDLDVVQGNIDDLGEFVGDIFNNVDAVIDDLGVLRSEIDTIDGEIIRVIEKSTSDFNILSDSISAGVTSTRTYAEEVATQAKTDAKSDAKTYTDTQVNTVKATATSNFDILAGRINTKAESSVVTSLGTRVTVAETSVNALSGEITSKVSKSDYTGNVVASMINQTATTVLVKANSIEMEGIVRLGSSIELGPSSGGQKAIKFNGVNAWIYSNGDFTLTLDASNVNVQGSLFAWHRHFNGLLPAIVGTSTAQDLAIGLTPNGVLNVYRANGTFSTFSPD